MSSELLREGCLVEIMDEDYSFVVCHLYKNDNRNPFYVSPFSSLIVPPVSCNLRAGVTGILIKSLPREKGIRNRGRKTDYLVLVNEMLYVVPDYGIREMTQVCEV